MASLDVDLYKFCDIYKTVTNFIAGVIPALLSGLELPGKSSFNKENFKSLKYPWFNNF